MADWYEFLVTFSSPVTVEIRKDLCHAFTERDYDFPTKTIENPGIYSSYRNPLELKHIVDIFNKHGVSGQFWMYKSGSRYGAYTDAKVVEFGPEVTDPFQRQNAFWDRERQKILNERVSTYLNLCRSFRAASLPINHVALGILDWHLALSEESVKPHKNVQPYLEIPPPSTVKQFEDAIRISLGDSR